MAIDFPVVATIASSRPATARLLILKQVGPAESVMVSLSQRRAAWEVEMRTIENRGRYDRGKLRYPCDLVDAEWGYRAVNPSGQANWQQENRRCARDRQRSRSPYCVVAILGIDARGQSMLSAYISH